MRVRNNGGKLLILGSFLALSVPLSSHSAAAATGNKHGAQATQAGNGRDLSTYGRRTAYERVHGAMSVSYLHGGHGYGRHGYAHAAGYTHYAGISCVPYARSVSGIDLPGNAWQWWDNAAGVYARGEVPEAGSVLSFTANGRMRLGHVAVVSRVINSREIEVDQANWGGGISHGTPVVDVSENNDWTAVRVGLGQSGEFGSVYPTNGFIYNRPDSGTMLASVSNPAPQPSLNPAPADLRPWTERVAYTGYDEVAEAPAPHASHHHGHHPIHHPIQH